MVCTVTVAVADGHFLWCISEQAAARRVAYHTFAHVLELDIKFHLDRRTGRLSRILERGEGTWEIAVCSSAGECAVSQVLCSDSIALMHQPTNTPGPPYVEGGLTYVSNLDPGSRNFPIVPMSRESGNQKPNLMSIPVKTTQ
jgi:hypothetical protein